MTADKLPNMEILTIKAWCPHDGGHEFETDENDRDRSLNMYVDFEVCIAQIRCPIHGWQEAT